MTVGACKRLAFQPLGVSLQTAHARSMVYVAIEESYSFPLSLLPEQRGAASYISVSMS
jgi:hypothetical protein